MHKHHWLISKEEQGFRCVKLGCGAFIPAEYLMKENIDPSEGLDKAYEGYREPRRGERDNSINAAEQQLKTCTVCKEDKPRSEFHRRRASSDGLQSRCKPCNVAVVQANKRKQEADLRLDR